MVLVSGATGGVGTFAVQLAAATGAAVLGTAATDEAARTLRSLGATGTVDHTGDLAVAVRGVAPRGVTAVIHAAGDAGGLFPLLAAGGRFASALGATQDQSGRDDITVTPVLATATRDKLTALLGQVAAGTLQATIAATYPLSDAPDALTAFGAHKIGKVVVSVDRGSGA